LEEFLMPAEYVMSEGNYHVILCERGVRTFADHTRNTLDLSIVPAVQRLSHLPIIVDPSHGTGKRNKVTPLSRAAIAVGADGLLVEVHTQPDQAFSDGIQSLYPDQFDHLMTQVRQIAPILGRSVPAIGPHPASAKILGVQASAQSATTRLEKVTRTRCHSRYRRGTRVVVPSPALPAGLRSPLPRIRLRYQRQKRYGQC